MKNGDGPGRGNGIGGGGGISISGMVDGVAPAGGNCGALIYRGGGGKCL